MLKDVKKILYLTIVLFTFLVGKGQTNIYHPFPDANAVWREDFNYNPCNCPGSCLYGCGYNIQYFIDGDTIINSLSYHKVYKKSNYFQNSGTSPTYTIFFAGIRQNTILRKVFCCIPPNVNDTLLYDFTMLVGDTLKGYLSNGFSIKVDSIDSILIGSNYRKRFNLNFFNYSIIEGIGFTAGLFDNNYSFEQGGNLLCFIQNSQTLYPDATTDCNQILLDIKEIEQYQLKIYPNPMFTSTLILSDKKLDNATLIVNDILGRNIKTINHVTGDSIKINRDNLYQGIYFLQVLQDNKILTTTKIIIAD